MILSPAPGCPQHHVLGLPAAPRPRFALSPCPQLALDLVSVSCPATCPLLALDLASVTCLQFALSTVSLVCPQLMSLACPVGVDSQCFVAVHLANPAAAAGGCPAMEDLPPSLPAPPRGKVKGTPG